MLLLLLLMRVPQWWTQKQGDRGGDPEVGGGRLGRGQVSQLGVLEEMLPSQASLCPSGKWVGGAEMPASMVQHALRVRCSKQRQRWEGYPAVQGGTVPLPLPHVLLHRRCSPSPAGPAPTSWVGGSEPPHLLTCLLQIGSPWGTGQSEGASPPSSLPSPGFCLSGLCDSSKPCSFLGPQFPHPKNEVMIIPYFRMS